MSLLSFVGGISNVVAPPPPTSNGEEDACTLRLQLQSREAQVVQLTQALALLSQDLDAVKAAKEEDGLTASHYKQQLELYVKELQLKEKEVQQLQQKHSNNHQSQNGLPNGMPVDVDSLRETLQHREDQVTRLMMEGTSLRQQMEVDEERHLASLQVVSAEVQRLQLALQAAEQQLEAERFRGAAETDRAALLQREMDGHLAVWAAKADADGALRREMAALQAKVEQLEDQLSQQRSYAAMLAEERSEWQAADVPAMQQRAAALEGEVGTLREELEAAQMEAAAHLQVLTLKKEEEGLLAGRVSQLQAELIQERELVAHWSASCKQLEQENERHLELLTVKQQSESTLRHQLEDTTSQLAAALASLAEAAAELDQLKGAVDPTLSPQQLQQQVWHLQQQEAKLLAQAEEAQATLRTLRGDFEACQGLLATRDAEYWELKATCQDLQSRLATASAEAEGHLSALAAKSEGEAALRDTVRGLQERCDQLRDALAQQTSFVEALQADAASAATLQAERADVEAQLRALRRDHDALAERNRQLEEEVEGHLTVLTAKREAEAEAQRRCSALQRQLSDAQREAQEYLGEVQMLKAQLGSGEASDADAHRQIHALTKDLDQARAALERLQAECVAWEEERAAMEGRLLAQQAELHAAHARRDRAAVEAAQQLEEQRTELETLRATVVIAHETCQSLAQDKAVLEEEIEGHLRTLQAKQQAEQRLQREREALKREVAALAAIGPQEGAAEVQAVIAERDQYRQLLEEREEEVAYCKAQLMAGNMERVELLAARADLQFRLGELQAKLEAEQAHQPADDAVHRAESDRLQEEVGMLSQALTAKQEQEHVLKEELRHAVARHDRLAARAAELEAQLREAQHRRPSPAQQVQFPGQEDQAMVTEDYGPQQGPDTETGWQSPLRGLDLPATPNPHSGADSFEAEKLTSTGTRKSSSEGVPPARLAQLQAQASQVEDVLAQQTNKLAALGECLGNMDEVLLGSRQLAEQVVAQLYENSVLLQQRDRAFQLVGEMEKYRSHALRRAQHFAQKAEKKNAELLHLEMMDLRRDAVRLSTLLEEMGSLLWAASQQMERPWEAAQNVIDAVGIAAHTVEEGKLHAEVVRMLLGLAQQSAAAVRDATNQLQGQGAGPPTAGAAAVGPEATPPSGASKAVTETLVNFPLPPPPPPFTPPLDPILPTPIPAVASVPISKFIERPVNLERLAPKRAKLQPEAPAANEIQWIAGELYSMAAGAAKLFGWG